MARKAVVLVALLALQFTQPKDLYAQSSAEYLSSVFANYKGKAFACTKVRKAMRRMRTQYPEYYFAFAGRKAPTITGIRGCGYSWGLDEETAKRKALEFCKEQEVALGTAGGSRTCRLMG